MQDLIVFFVAVAALSVAALCLVRLFVERDAHKKRVDGLNETLQQLNETLRQQEREFGSERQQLREQLDGASRATDEALMQLENERRRYTEVFATIEGIVGERDKWRELYDKQGREYGAAQALLVEQNDRLARIAIRHGAKIKLHPVLNALREDHGMPDLPTATITLEMWELLAGVAPVSDELDLSQLLRRVEELASSGCAWSSKYPNGAKRWASKAAEALENVARPVQVVHSGEGSLAGNLLPPWRVEATTVDNQSTGCPQEGVEKSAPGA
jgi:hypothetical protein